MEEGHDVERVAGILKNLHCYEISQRHVRDKSRTIVAKDTLSMVKRATEIDESVCDVTDHGNVCCSPLFFTVDWMGSGTLLWRRRPWFVEFHCVEPEDPGSVVPDPEPTKRTSSCFHWKGDAERVLDVEGSGASQSRGFLQTSSVNVLNSKPFGHLMVFDRG